MHNKKTLLKMIKHLKDISRLGGEAMHKKYSQKGKLNPHWKGGFSSEPYSVE